MSKTDRVIELLKTMILNEESMDPLIDTMIKQTEAFGKHPKKSTKEVLKPVFTSEHFLMPFAEKYKDLYTDEEINMLLQVYKSEAMLKMLESSKLILNDLYPEMQKKVESMCI